jgi:hypothetical protein
MNTPDARGTINELIDAISERAKLKYDLDDNCTRAFALGYISVELAHVIECMPDAQRHKMLARLQQTIENVREEIAQSV